MGCVTLYLLFKIGYQYTNKIHSFLTENNIQPLHKNLINKDRKHIQETLQQNNLNFKNRQVKYILQKTQPHLHWMHN